MDKAADLELSRRWRMARVAAGLGAAGLLSLYLIVKVVWVILGLAGVGPEQMGGGTSEWVMLNAFTIVMAVTGMALGLALARPWGRRIPAPPVIFFAWMAGGFLIPMVPVALIGAALGGSAPENETAMPGWEMAFISIGFTGTAVGLAVALPIYMRERWPRAFVGSLTETRARIRPVRSLAPVLVATLLLAVLWFSWVLGGTLGIDPARAESMDLTGRLRIGSSAVWALLGGWSVWTLARRGAGRLPLWVPMTVGFVASGSLFAWSSWKLATGVLLRSVGYVTLEHPGVAVVEHGVAMTAGLAIISVLIRAHTAEARMPYQMDLS